jgi:hypothetical protein
MDDKEHQSKRDQRLKKSKSGNPFGRLNAKSVRLQYAKVEAASKNSQHQGPESRKKH